MSRNLFLFITGLILSVFLAGFLLKPVPPPPKTYEFKIEKVGKVWKVDSVNNPKVHKVIVHRKDTIIWTPVGTDVYIQFPDTLFKAVGPGDKLKNGYTKFLRDGKKLRLMVRDSAKLGTYEYAIFCMADSTFARGDSPPKIIIK